MPTLRASNQLAYIGEYDFFVVVAGAVGVEGQPAEREFATLLGVV